MRSLLLIILGLSSANLTLLAEIPRKAEEPTSAFQAAKRVAYMENTQNLPAKGLTVGRRAVAKSLQLPSVKASQESNR